MIIGIDISSIPYGTGVSEYTRQLVLNLLLIDSKNQYKLFFGSLRQKLPVDFLNQIKKHPNCKLYSYPLPPTLLDLLWNKLHILPIEYFIGSCDIFHTSDWTQPPSKKAHTIATIHDLTPLLFPAWHHQKTVTAHQNKISRLQQDSASLIFVSKSTRSDFFKLFPNYDSKNIEIYEAADSGFVPISKPNSDYFLTVGTREPRKNLINVFKAFTSLKQKYPKMVIKVAGKYGWGEDVAPVDGIEVLGYVSKKELIRLHQNAFALIYPSLYEGFGLPVLSSLSCGVPVITSNLSSMPEIAGKGALLVDPTNSESIKKAMYQLLTNKNLYQKLKKQTLLQARKFSWEKTAKSTLEFYKKLS